MKFYGKGIVWDKETDKPLFVFDKKDEFETEDPELIDKILSMGIFKSDEPKQKPESKKKK